MKDTRDVEKGEEITDSYGAYGAAKYFTRYGFFETRFRDEYLVTFVNEIPLLFPRSVYDQKSPTFQKKRELASDIPW